MAITQNDGSIILSTKVDTGGINKGLSSIEAQAKKTASTVGKAFLAIGAAATAVAVAIVKKSTDAYAEYEQLVGGVETLFKDSADKIKAYASDAFFTAGVSANEYMRQVTSFSASLIKSVAGDTDKAADIANMALIDISDNVNKMGSSMESVTLAYQGFAKQQYMLLDNLKLGYGGTKTEMERLLKDAEALTGVKYDISNLADVYTAIHVIQENLGIAGTTALEAEKTISGSAATMKAAWQNVLTAISGGGDLDRAINNLVDSISNYFENIVPVVERALAGIGTLIEKVAPMLVQTVARALIKAIPSLLAAVYEMIIGLAKGIYQGIIDLFTGVSSEILTEQPESIKQSTKNQKDLTKAVEETNDAMKKTTASFDTVQILSSGISESVEDTTLVPETASGGIGTMNFEESERELSSFEKTLKKSFKKISKVITDAWNSKPIQAFWGAVTLTAQNALESIINIGSNIWQNVSTTWGNIKDDFEFATSNMGELWTTFWTDIQQGVDTWSEPITESFNGLFTSIWESAISPFIEGVTVAWGKMASALNQTWSREGKSIVDNVGLFFKNILETFRGLYDNVLKPIIEPFLKKFKELWNGSLGTMVQSVVDFVAKLVNAALTIYNNFIQPITMWIQEKLNPIFTFLGQFISDTFGGIVEVLSDTFGGIFESLGGLLDFITGVFSGDWEKAWNGIKQIFSGIWDSIKSVATGAINVIIDAINLFIKGMNLVKWELPNWDILGSWAGKTFGINIPLIPRLAQGAVLPGGKPFLAMLGDQPKGQTNIETPLDTMVEAFQKALDSRGETAREEHYYLDDTQVMSIIYKLVKGGERLSGDGLVEGGVY